MPYIPCYSVVYVHIQYTVHVEEHISQSVLGNESCTNRYIDSCTVLVCRG